jgi:branched-chain amino acid transport system substrate-binding protein
MLTACTGITGQATTEPIKVGWIGALTGPQAAVGIDAAVAARMAIDDLNAKGGINGKHVELLVEDDEYNAVNTISAYHKLKGEGAQVIIMSTYGAIFALGEQAQQDGIIIVDTLDCDQGLAQLGENVFCIAPRTEDKAHAIAKQTKTLGAQKVGILYNNGDTFMPTVKDLITGELGVEHTISEPFVPTTTDFRTPLLKMQRAGAQGIIFLGNDEIGLAMKQARDMGFEGPFFGTGSVTSPGMQAASHGAIEGISFGFWQAPAQAEYTAFIARYEQQEGRKPIIEFVTAATYDAVGVIAQGYQNANSTTSLAEAIGDVRNYRGISSVITFDAQGAASLPITVHQLRNGTAVPLE